jgi:hypothetical protein
MRYRRSDNRRINTTACFFSQLTKQEIVTLLDACIKQDRLAMKRLNSTTSLAMFALSSDNKQLAIMCNKNSIKADNRELFVYRNAEFISVSNIDYKKLMNKLQSERKSSNTSDYYAEAIYNTAKQLLAQCKESDKQSIKQYVDYLQRFFTVNVKESNVHKEQERIRAFSY